ncbi:benzoate/H(+) symporter BenE family transporter [Marinomonas sp. M1K-6]|uniref:Benzoate/H(+) symporter BenE family transporter n=1 Tax=Marinomonas profundi TaxID=2726122 RepID=A0A847R8N8_9GAMM|nr:benzoate/H(+) symporter BenE family transporter [Marinomonas profundi]NLQ18833.1 benzoate/H(+) symporter BenE family transporter [Marinomonas profundi]UDV02961.1 benzoate/H(+) symporter BenE family transporter [Marinomonas profundi]
MLRILNDMSLSALVAGFVAVLIGFASSVAIVFQAAQAAGADSNTIVSWIMALGFGMGATCFFLSLWYRSPVITAWSTPGAALLATSLGTISYAEAIGVFVFAGLLTLLTGASGLFDKVMRLVPLPLACAMLAGVLFQFGLAIFDSMMSDVFLVGVMSLTYLVCKRFVPRYSVLFVLVVGVAIVLVRSDESLMLDIPFDVGGFVWVWPEWNLSALIGIGVPLYIVTMTSQNIPGVAVMRSSGYQTPVSPLISWTGFTSIILAPLGGFAFNLAAITAAICSGEECHKDPKRRYIAGLAAGIFYGLAGVAGASVVALFSIFPATMIAALAGIALLGTIGINLKNAMVDDSNREAALVTFLVTVSGVSFGGIASAFWGLLFGVICLLLSNIKLK